MKNVEIPSSMRSVLLTLKIFLIVLLAIGIMQVGYQALVIGWSNASTVITAINVFAIVFFIGWYYNYLNIFKNKRYEKVIITITKITKKGRKRIMDGRDINGQAVKISGKVAGHTDFVENSDVVLYLPKTNAQPENGVYRHFYAVEPKELNAKE